MFFLFGVKGGLLFLITKKEPPPKTSLFLEQQKCFRADLSAEPPQTLQRFKSLEQSFPPCRPPSADKMSPNPATVFAPYPPSLAPAKAYFLLKFSFINKRMNLTPYVQHVFFLLKL